MCCGEAALRFQLRMLLQQTAIRQAVHFRNSTMSREITNDDFQFCPKNGQPALEHLLHFRRRR
jgi:hypothetical protein